ncbi:MAG: sugar ABC transporter permease [Sphaerochaetaceae bacterium]
MKQQKLKLNDRKIAAYLFNLPGFLMFSFSIVIPFFMGINIAFTDWNGISSTYNYVGLKNFFSVFTDQRILLPIRNSLIFAALGVFGGTIFSLGMALLVNAKANKLSTFTRTIFFLPVCFSSILSAFIWKFIYKEVFFDLFAFKSPLGNPHWVLLAITVIGLWNTSGINMLIFLAGLKNVPVELYDASKVDGASLWKQFTNVTIPLITPSFTVCVTLSLTSWLREFATTLSATNGGPGGASRTLAIDIFEYLFNFNKAGYGQAVALLFALFCICIGITVSSFFRKREITL